MLWGRGSAGAPRPGRPRRLVDAQRLQLLALACEPAEDCGRATPTLDELCERALAHGVVERISRSHLQRILQAIERKHADRPPRSGHARRRGFGYIRHGTQALTAALDVHSGRVVASCTERRTQDDLVAFMERVASAYPRGTVHVIRDNLNTHRAHAVWDEFNARHGRRFVMHFTPLHASWVNQVELLFGIYARRVLRHASHTSAAHLRQRTETFVARRNAAPRPFKWTSAGFELQTGEPRTFARHARTPRQNQRR